MKIPSVALWTSVLSSFFYAHSLPPAQVVSRNLTLALDLSNTILSNVTLGEQSCRSHYGTELTLTSCTNAWKKIPRDSELYTYGLRADFAAGAHLDVGLPVRYLSDDGLCAIDIRAKHVSEAQFATGDSARNIEVSEAAKVVLDLCVRIRHQGGTVTGFSQRGLLAVVIMKYEPKAVCEALPEEIPFVPFCERVLQTMPARRQKDVFALITQPSRYYYALPKFFQYRESSNPLSATWLFWGLVTLQANIALHVSGNGTKMRRDRV